MALVDDLPIGLLTDRQEDIVRVVRELGSDGWPVSVREVMLELGYSSTEYIHRLMTELTDLGVLMRSPRSPRSGWRA